MRGRGRKTISGAPGAPGFVLSPDKSLGISTKEWLKASEFRADFTAKEGGSERF